MPVLLAHIAAIFVGQCSLYEMQTVPGPNCGILGHAGALGWGLSENGTICGELFKCDSNSLPFVQFASGPAIALTQVGAAKSGKAREVNSAGIVIGHVDNNALSFAFHAGTVTWLAPLSGHNVTEAASINDSGQIVGHSIDVINGPGPQAVTWIEGQPIGLGATIGPNSAAEGINEFGQICGWMGEHPTPGFTSSACIWHNGVITNLGVPPGAYATTAEAINNLGDACGFAIWPCSQCKVPIRRPCAWIDGQFIDLGAFAGLVGGLALDINDAGEIVGYCTNETGSNIAPFLWRGGVMRDLNDLVPAGSAVVSLPLAINNRGQIAGWGIGADNGVAFRITPALPQHAGDTNCDSAVNVNDLLDVINHWNPAGPVGGDPADLNRDNTINAFDLMEVIFHWGQ